MSINYNKPRIGRPSQTVGSSTHVGGAGAGPNDPCDAPVLACTECDRVFSSKIGIGVHMRRAHCEVANNLINTTRTKARWCLEESRLVASYEAEARADGVCGKGMDRLLAELHPLRTLNAIRCNRRKTEYKTLVDKYLGEILSQRNTPPNRSARPALNASASDTPNDEDSLLETADDRGEHLSPVRRALSVKEMAAAKKAVEMLTTVSGHGSETLLLAAERFSRRERKTNG